MKDRPPGIRVIYDIVASPSATKFIPPEFGSAAAGRYRVIVGDRPEMARIPELVKAIVEQRRASNKPILLLQADALSAAMRKALTAEAQRQSASFFLIDRAGVIFVALHADEAAALGESTLDLLMQINLPLSSSHRLCR